MTTRRRSLAEIPPTELPTRFRVFRLLAEGHGIPHAAQRVGISKQTAHAHARALLTSGALQHVPGSRSPLRFTRGPRASEYEALTLRQVTDGSGRSGRQVLGAAVRVHAGEYWFDVVSGPSMEPAWRGYSAPSGVENRRLRLTVGDAVWGVRDVRGRRKHRLGFQPPAQEVVGAAEVLAIRERWRDEVVHVARAFAREHGYVLAGHVDESRPLEYGIAVPGLRPTGTPGESATWVDESPGEPELETRSAAIAAAVADLPAWKDDLDAWRRRVDEQLTRAGATEDVVREVLTRVVELQERAAASKRLLTSSAVHAATAITENGNGAVEAHRPEVA